MLRWVVEMSLRYHFPFHQVNSMAVRLIRTVQHTGFCRQASKFSSFVLAPVRTVVPRAALDYIHSTKLVQRGAFSTSSMVTNGGNNSSTAEPKEKAVAGEVSLLDYVGDRKNGVPHGKGKAIWSDGTTYEGEFQNGKPHGKGTRTTAGGTETCSGEWKDGLRQGFCTETTPEWTLSGHWPLTKENRANFTLAYKDGLVYQGDMKLSRKKIDTRKPSGKGTITYLDGLIYTGEFKNGRRHGMGRTTTAKGKVLYEGMYDSDSPTTSTTVGPVRQRREHHKPGTKAEAVTDSGDSAVE